MGQRALLHDAESIQGNQRPRDSLGNNLCCVKCGMSGLLGLRRPTASQCRNRETSVY